jgi:hypothetical protein
MRQAITRARPIVLLAALAAGACVASPARPPAEAPAVTADAGPPPRAPDGPRDVAPPSEVRPAPADTPPEVVPADVGSARRRITVSGYQLLVQTGAGAPIPYDLRGISWSPAAPGTGKPGPSDFTAAVAQDLPMMRAAGINTVKVYGPLPRVVLDELHAHGMTAIVTVVLNGAEDFAGYVTALRDHPAILMWMVGNEWNLNHLYGGCAADACPARINELVRAVKALDPDHPVATSFAPTDASGVPTANDVRRLDAVDVWGLNVYSQPGFFNRFQAWRLLAQSTGRERPFFMSEYGADAYDNRTRATNEAAQATALRQQTNEIRAQLSARNAAFPCLGGTPFEWNDEWWKAGAWTAQDPGGFSNGGVAPDSFANEDWWGVVDIHPTTATSSSARNNARNSVSGSP